jgi:hypothetical protein
VGIHFVLLASGRVDRDTDDDDEIARSFGRTWCGICEFGVLSLNQGVHLQFTKLTLAEKAASWVPGGNEDKLP